MVAQDIMESTVAHIDTSGRAICIATDMRRTAWLCASKFNPDVQEHILDLLFEGGDLFHTTTDEELDKKKNSLQTT